MNGQHHEAEEVEFRHKALLITIHRTADSGDVYEAVRYAWRVNPEKARQAEVVLAVERGVIIGVFIPDADGWHPAPTDKVPDFAPNKAGRWGFKGNQAPHELAQHYVERLVPAKMRKPGAANPIRYSYP